MLDRGVVKELIDKEFKDSDLEIPKDISKNALVEAFCMYAEDDYYEWIKDNINSFFNHYNPDWDWIRNKCKSYKN